MPKPGFKSITVNEASYKRWHDVYLKTKEDLKREGVETFTAFLTHTIMQIYTKQATKMRFSVILATKKMVILTDEWEHKTITLERVEPMLNNHLDYPFAFACSSCHSLECMHIGFISTLWQTYGEP